MLDIPVPKYVDSASIVSATPVPIVILGIVPSFAMGEDLETATKDYLTAEAQCSQRKMP
jgi:hypothetical protein